MAEGVGLNELLGGDAREVGMSDVMLLGVLRMPPECWSNDPIDQMQRHARYMQAADELESLRAHVADCEAVLRQLARSGWAHDALASGDTGRIGDEICALKRQARGVLNTPPNA